MIKFNFNKEKSIAALLYILTQITKADLHKISKILYFADQKHIKRFGNPITGDYYIAMQYGPVPSNIYDILKSVRDDGYFKSDEFKKVFRTEDNYSIIALQQPDLDEFSESDLECLNESIAENKDKSFNQLIDKSHSEAYKKTCKDNKISFENIAYEIGANEEMVKYMETVSENSYVFS